MPSINVLKTSTFSFPLASLEVTRVTPAKKGESGIIESIRIKYPLSFNALSRK